MELTSIGIIKAIARETSVVVLSAPMSLMTKVINDIKSHRQTTPNVSINNMVRFSFQPAAVMERSVAVETIIKNITEHCSDLTNAEKIVVGIRCYIASSNEPDSIEFDPSVLYGAFLPSEVEIVEEWAIALVNEKTAWHHSLPVEDFTEIRELAEMRLIALLSRMRGGKEVPDVVETIHLWLEV